MARTPRTPRRRLNLTNPPSLAAHIVLDASGSMATLANDAIGGVNDYIATLKRETPDAVVSLTLFSYPDDIRTVYTNTPVTEVAPLTAATYRTSGGTALYDAINHAVQILDTAVAANKAIIILTDGEENSSRTYRKEGIRALLTDRQEQQNWLVSYLGANQDAFQEGGAIGTSQGTTMSFASTGAGLRSSLASASASTVRYTHSGGDLGVASYTDREREQSSDEDDNA